MIEGNKLDGIMKFCSTNKIVFDLLQESVRNKRVIPFVGAGISAFAYKTWNDMLLELSAYLNEEEKSRAIYQINIKQYLDAAQTICDGIGETLFFQSLRRLYSEEKIRDNILKENAAYYIPKICGGNCLTTNYDRVLEHSCLMNSIVFDTASINETVKLATFFRSQNKHGLIFKIHGDILSNKDNLLLSRTSFEKHYAKGSELRRQLERWLSGRTLLFVGSSLFNDEPIQVLTDIIEEGMDNYAIYSCSKNEIEMYKNKFEELKILPIFYDKNDHSSLILLLKRLLDE